MTIYKITSVKGMEKAMDMPNNIVLPHTSTGIKLQFRERKIVLELVFAVIKCLQCYGK